MSWRIKLKRLLCRHRYRDVNLTSCSVTGGYIFKNYCIKCGKPYSIEVSNRWIDRNIEEDKERMSKDGYFTGKY